MAYHLARKGAKVTVSISLRSAIPPARPLSAYRLLLGAPMKLPVMSTAAGPISQVRCDSGYFAVTTMTKTKRPIPDHSRFRGVNHSRNSSSRLPITALPASAFVSGLIAPVSLRQNLALATKTGRPGSKEPVDPRSEDQAPPALRVDNHPNQAKDDQRYACAPPALRIEPSLKRPKSLANPHHRSPCLVSGEAYHPCSTIKPPREGGAEPQASSQVPEGLLCG